MTRRQLGARKHDGSGGDHAAVADPGTVENDDVVLDDALVAHRARMHRRVDPDGDVMADLRRQDLVRDVDRGARPQPEIVADRDVVAIGADRGQRTEVTASPERGTAGSAPSPKATGGSAKDGVYWR
ncbi:MAG: hypothetical protein U1F52_06760 [Burkholderiales bacterium]